MNRALVKLLASKSDELRQGYGIAWRITGVAARRMGWIARREGIEPAALLAEPAVLPAPREDNVRSWLKAAGAGVLFEATSLQVENGQPAIEHLRAALESGAHAITANKGAVVYGYDELRQLAAEKGRRFLFESTVMDGAPIFSLFDRGLPAVELRGLHGILNSTTNVILSGMEEGLSFDDSLRRAQEMGIAETDAGYDIDGWDAAMKLTALVRVLMRAPLMPRQVRRVGIRGLDAEAVRAAAAEGRRYKLVCRAARTAGGVEASIQPELLPIADPMAQVTGASSIVCFETDIFPGLVITENHPGLETTAYGMLADFVRAVGA